MLNEFEEPMVHVHKEGLLSLKDYINRAVDTLDTIKKFESTWTCDACDSATEMLTQAQNIVEGYLKVRR